MNLIKVDWKLRQEFWDWCEQHGTTPQHQLAIHPRWDVWYVPDSEVYLLAKLRW